MERKQFTFYRSYLDAIRRLPKKEQGNIVLAICNYALDETIPSGLSPIADTVFTLVKPTLDASRHKAEAGKCGGKSEATAKQTASKTQANVKQTASEKEREKEKEIEIEIEKENECSISTTVYGGSERTRSLPSEEEEEAKTESKSEAESNPNTSRASAFDAFWSAYPKKVGKGAAEKAFSKLSLSLLPQMLSAIDAQKKSEQWKKDGGQFIPNPATWLNQRRWEDELPVAEEAEKKHSAFQELEFENYNDPVTGELKARIKGNA